MSRIGKKEIIIPTNTTVEIDKIYINIEGPKGQLCYKIPKSIQVTRKDNKLQVYKTTETRQTRAIYGLSRSLIDNMITGVSKGFEKKLIIQGVGYRAQLEDENLILNVGYSHPVIIKPIKGIRIQVENNINIIVNGINKEKVGQVAATIRDVRRPEPYKGKGIRYSYETIRRKVGKAGK